MNKVVDLVLELADANSRAAGAEMAVRDLRELLRKYIERVQIEEGTSFIPLRFGDPMDVGWWQTISREEWELLNELRNELCK